MEQFLRQQQCVQQVLYMMDIPRPVELLWDNRDALTGHVCSNANLIDLA